MKLEPLQVFCFKMVRLKIHVVSLTNSRGHRGTATAVFVTGVMIFWEAELPLYAEL